MPTHDRARLIVVLLSPRTRENLRRTNRCGLIAIEGTTAHYLKMDAVTIEERDDFLGVVLAVHTHKADSLGIPLEPVTFTATESIADLERWERAQAVLNWLDRR